VDLDYLYSILESVQRGEAGELSRIATEMAVRSLSFGAALQDLAALLTRLQIEQMAAGSIDEEDPDRARLLVLASRLSPEFVQLVYQIAIQGRAELALAPDEYSGFLMTLMRIHAFRPESVADVLSSVESAVRRNTREHIPKAKPLPLDEPGGKGVMADRQINRPTASEAIGWHQMVAELQINGLAKELAQHCELRGISESECVLRISPAQGHLQMKPAPDKLRRALSDYLGRAITLRFELAQTESETPAATVGRERLQRQEQAVASIEKDSFVRDVIESCDASLVESSIKPIV
jgi:DNA polymerase-3 subunit gamma/tau